MLMQFKINRYRHQLAKEIRRRNRNHPLYGGLDRHEMDQMIKLAILSGQSPVNLEEQLSRLEGQKRKEREINFQERLEQLTARAKA